MQTPGSPILVFENVEFDVVDIRNVPWLRGPQIAGALGYNRDDRIADLYARNTDEFTDEMTQVVDLDTAGGRQQVRIFSPRGCYLLGMLARTDRAKEFRRWVLDVLEGRVIAHDAGRVTPGQRLAALRYRGTLAKDLSVLTERGVATELYANLRHVSRLLGMPVGSFETLTPGIHKQQQLIE